MSVDRPREWQYPPDRCPTLRSSGLPSAAAKLNVRPRNFALQTLFPPPVFPKSIRSKK